MRHDQDLPGFALTRLARAKVNLALHVVGQRADGHHLLESLVVFAETGDRIGLSPADEDRLTLSGPYAGALEAEGGPPAANLVIRARDLLRGLLRAAGLDAPPVHLHLEKNLPVASGIGGGSADAAAALAGLAGLWGAPEQADLASHALALGADLPMCLTGRPLVARGIGERIELLDTLPRFAAVLVNPGVAVSTPVIFRSLTQKINPGLVLPSATATSADDWLEALAAMRNDLEPPARALAPEIGMAGSAILDQGARLVRMSGSGATCFGLFASLTEAEHAADALSQMHPGWYVQACNTGGSASHGRT